MLCFYCTCSTIVSLLAASAATTEVLFHMTKTTGCETNVSDLVTRGASCKWWKTTRHHFVVLWQKTAEAAGQLLSTAVDKLAAASRSAAPSRSSTCSVSCAPQKMTDSVFFFVWSWICKKHSSPPEGEPSAAGGYAQGTRCSRVVGSGKKEKTGSAAHGCSEHGKLGCGVKSFVHVCGMHVQI